MKRKQNKGVTLVELMITLAIIAIVLSIAVITMSGFIPKQRLISAQGQLSDLLQRAQTEANARSYWTCVAFSSAGSELTGQIYVDTAAPNHGSANSCGGSDTPLNTITMKDGIDFGSGSGCTNNIKRGCVIWFDTTGSPKLCAGGTLSDCGAGAGSSGLTGTNCIDWSYQIVITQPKLASGNRAREIEALQGGLIQVVKPSETGRVSTNAFTAKTPSNPSGCE